MGSSVKIVAGILPFAILLIAMVGVALPIDYAPDHPDVQAMVNRGIAYLEKQAEGTGGDFGDAILPAIAIYKVRGDANHPMVVRGIQAALRLARGLGSSARISGEKIIYESAIATILLASVDAEKHEDACVAFRDFFQRVQRPYGAFGYLEGSLAASGDTSMTQYAMLAIWTLDQVGIGFETAGIEAMVKWLQQTQDPSGGWGYQGKIGTSGLVAQDTVTHSLTAAGLGSYLIAADFLEIYRNHRGAAEEDYIPRAFRRVVEGTRQRKVTLEKRDLEGTLDRATRWVNNNAYTRGVNFHYYYLYSEERMQSFLEIAKGKQQKSPLWYNRGVELLKRTQDENGAWGVKDPDYYPPRISTSFAILYLIRSTQKTIGALNEGLMRGGYQLPKDLTNVEDMDGKIIDRSKKNTLDEVLMLLEQEDAGKSTDTVVSERLKLESDPKRRKEQLGRLSRLLSSKDHNARRAAAKLLGRGDDLELVPALVYALGDGDAEVCRQAETSLRILSRRLNVRYLPDADDRPFTETEKKKARDGWKAWYYTIHPEYVFVD